MHVKIFTMVKDEEDIIEYWINYHGSIFGYRNLYIIDNMSTDGTYEKIMKYKPFVKFDRNKCLNLLKETFTNAT